MVRLARSPPVVGLALAAAAGATLLHLGVPLSWTLLPFLTSFLLSWPFQRPGIPLRALSLAFLAGCVFTHQWQETSARDCRFHLGEGQALHLSGRLVGPLVEGRGEFLPVSSEAGACREPLRLVVTGPEREKPEAGEHLSVHGRWRRNQASGPVVPLRAGYLRVDSINPLPAPAHLRIRDAMVVGGGWVQSRLERLFPRTAPLAVALVWARKDSLTPEIRESFARAGAAHLLAISGFHVGVVAGVFLLGLSLLGLSHPLRYLLASLGVWVYVFAIGVPDAAFRAALLLSILALGRASNRAVAPLGALATASLVFLILDPGALLRPGFQLSFAGALGLVVAYRPLTQWISSRGGGLIPHYLCQGIAAGGAATVATLPLVAWHFDRVSLVGIPLTLLVTPLVALAIPGIFLTLLLSLVNSTLARFLASGVELVLELMLEIVSGAAALPFASMWISHTAVLAGTASLGAAILFLAFGPKVGKGGRHQLLGMAVVAGLLMGTPVSRLLNRGVIELVVLDVGQGDAALLRSPGGRWVLVDAGPKTRTFDAGARTVLPYLRRRGVEALDLMILTHPDMDHVGGAASILEEFPVRAVLDPGVATGTEVFLDALEAAGERGIPWHVMAAGDSLNLDGMAVRVLAPKREDSGPTDDRNDASLVLEIRFGAFAALLTGDAPAASEERFLPRILSPRIQVLKVGHHGSSTSTTSELLERVDPGTALISVGKRNGFGHPHPATLARLRQAGARLFRTDEGGVVVVRARQDGSYRVSAEYR
ncbi:MAG: DNA internalization-related competence protein ComEC/Rec2 [Longimicrobiales bacterium]|nr:DNA internalization-related competence protein ComEC/Rec2 [Longimicrobiales bacterium]